MKDELFFHVRTDGIRPHTYCVKRSKVSNDLYVGYSIVHERDQFCKKTGRYLAKRIAASATTIPDEDWSLSISPEYPESIQKSIKSVVQKSGEIFGISGKVYVKSIVRGKTKKAPVAKIFEITKS